MKRFGKHGVGLFRNLSIRRKMLVGFGIVFIMLLGSIATTYWSISGLGNQIGLYSKFTVPLTISNWNVQRDMAKLQRALLMAINQKDRGEDFEPTLALADEYGKGVRDAMDYFANNQRSTASDADIAQALQFMTEGGQVRQEIYNLLRDKSATADAAFSLFQEKYLPTFNACDEIMENLNEIGASRAQTQKSTSEKLISQSWIVLAGVVALSLISMVIAVISITNSILTPIKEMETVYEEIANGNLHAQLQYEGKDELGKMAQSIRVANTRLLAYIQDITQKLTLLANGDISFTVDSEYIGDFAEIKQVLLDTATGLNNTLSTIRTAAEQVNTGAGQVSSASMSLATGASQQAAAVEELSGAISSVEVQARENALYVREAMEYMANAGAGVAESNEQMNGLIQAMNEIRIASEKISSVTKVIEDIAFQTKILALNAAVEAAHANAAGKGFAVVAEEVRNLATKSSEAAKQTAELISHSALSVAEGDKRAARTAEILKEVAEKASLADKTVRKIEVSSSEQAVAIAQITKGLSQVSAIVQTNAASSEESSATSQELAAQALTMQSEVMKFNLANT